MALSRRSFGSVLAGAALAPSALPALSPPSKLTVLAVAEQFRTDYLATHANVFGTGGFGRLIDSGAYYPNCFLDSTSFTASGLATISTGAHPAVHGVVADRWLDRSARETVAARPQALEATTFASRFLASDPRNRCYGVAFDESEAGLIAAGNSFGIDRFPVAYSPDRKSAVSWTALGSTSATPMRTIAFDPARAGDFVNLWKGSPAGQAAEFGFARDLVTREELGRGPSLDLLVLVLGSLGTLGYESGAASPLVFDLVSHLDRQIESILSFLDETLGERNYQFVFTGAHGAPDRADRYIASQDVVDVAERAGGPVDAYIYPFLYLNRGNRRATALAVAKAGLAAAWYTADGDCSHTGEWRRRMENSFHRERSGDVMLVYPPNCMENYSDGRGVSYGSLYNYDTRVPLIFFGPRFNRATHDETVQAIDIAPTLSHATGSALPSSSTGRVLGSAFFGGSR